MSNSEKTVRVRFAQIDGAHVIYYPRYLEMISDAFQDEIRFTAPFELSIAFKKPNRLGDDIRMRFEGEPTAWSVSGHLDGEHFRIELAGDARGAGLSEGLPPPGAYRAEGFDVADWMCGPDRRIQVSRYFELISNTVEQWFESELDMPFQGVSDMTFTVFLSHGDPFDVNWTGTPSCSDNTVSRSRLSVWPFCGRCRFDRTVRRPSTIPSSERSSRIEGSVKKVTPQVLPQTDP